MSRRLTHISFALVLLLSSEVWAIGLGDIQLDSALNEPLRAEIPLLSATPDELANLAVTLASSETFARYGIDRPFFLQDMEFNIVGSAAGSVVQIRSRSPITEPFLTFLVEATWPSGRLLREYTVLLDPPTYVPPAAQQAPAVTAPSRSAPADSGQIERLQPVTPEQPPRPATQARPAPQPSPPPRPAPSAPVDDSPYDSAAGGDYAVARGDSLWGIASRMRPDSRLTMNQTMLAIYEANPDAFGGNINVLRAGASLRIPSADEIFRISRNNAFSEVKRQNEAWSGGYTAPAETRPSLTLVPPDEEPADLVYDDDLTAVEPPSREQEIENRIAELEAADVPDQPSLLEIRDNELATLRQELANIRGEVYEPPVDVTTDEDVAGVDDVLADEDELEADTAATDEAVAADDAVAADEDAAEPVDAEAPSTVIRTTPEREESILDRILGFVTGTWAWIGAALVLLAGLLFWFMRRGGDAEEAGPWETLDSDEMEPDSHAATETMMAPTPDEAIVVVEQDSGIRPLADETVEIAPAAEADAAAERTGEFASIEDTFSSDTAVNLDQTDPIAEADFHMAYGLYDQAADLVNGALENDPEDQRLMAKLCEIYFVWGNRDSFVAAAENLNSAVGDGDSAEWDKIVIMGQQIAGDHALFAGAGVAAAQAVDLSFEDVSGDTGVLDMDFGSDADTSGAVDLGAEESDAEGEIDFLFDDASIGDDVDMELESTAESPTIQTTGTAKTVAMPVQEATAESPTIEQQIDDMAGTSELPALDDTLEEAVSDAGGDAAETAEINLDELDLGLDELAETELASLDDLDATGTNEALEPLSEDVFADTGSVTGSNPEIDPNSTGVREGPDSALFGDIDQVGDDDATGEMRLAPDETGRMPMVDISDESLQETEVSIDQSLLESTGLTQVLSDDMAVDTLSGNEVKVPDDAETMLASLDEGEEENFDFASTEALPADIFEGDVDLDATGEMPAPAPGSTDVDLDLDDLTAALKLTEGGDTIDQQRDDATVEQPRPSIPADSGEVPTMELGPEDMSDELHEARTMTEVGTKLDLARAYVDMGDPAGARSILEEVLDEGDQGQRQQAQQLLDSLPS